MGRLSEYDEIEQAVIIDDEYQYYACKFCGQSSCYCCPECGEQVYDKHAADCTLDPSKR